MRTAAPPRTPTHASGYLTGLTTNEVQALLEQVENFFLSLTAVGALGGNTFIPEALTGLHRALEKFPVSTIPTEELCCLPGPASPSGTSTGCAWRRYRSACPSCPPRTRPDTRAGYSYSCSC